jgi:hypothetical protein
MSVPWGGYVGPLRGEGFAATYTTVSKRRVQMLLILSIVVILAAVVILPFWHMLGVGIFAALLFWKFHIHPFPVIALYLVAYCVRWLLVFFGLAGLFAWASREK